MKRKLMLISLLTLFFLITILIILKKNIIEYEYLDYNSIYADGTIKINWINKIKDYDEVTLFYAKNKKILKNYTEIITLKKGEQKFFENSLIKKTKKIKESISLYEISGFKYIPEESDYICAVFSKKNKKNIYEYYKIPKQKILKKEEPLYRFYSVSDLHISDSNTLNINQQNFFKDILENKQNIDFVIINGDLVDYGTTEQFLKFEELINENIRKKDIPVLFAPGNHEYNTIINDKIVQNENYDIKTLQRLYKENLDLLSKTNKFNINREEDKLYYYVDLDNIRFIFLSTPVKTSYGVNYSINNEQLDWLDYTLEDAKKTNKISFIFSHINLKKYVPYKENNGINNTETLINILKKYENIIISTGHTHTDLSKDNKHTIITNLNKGFSYYNSGSIVWSFEYDNNDKEYYNYSYSTGYIVEIYKDKILLKGRKFMDNTKYISTAHYFISL